MAAGGAFGGNRGLQPVPPEKGVFPLDHLHECQPVMRAYMECLRDNKYESVKCRNLSKEYLTCRMDRNLMIKQELSELGFTENEKGQQNGGATCSEPSENKVKEGFISGLPSKPRAKV